MSNSVIDHWKFQVVTAEYGKTHCASFYTYRENAAWVFWKFDSHDFLRSWSAKCKLLFYKFFVTRLEKMHEYSHVHANTRFKFVFHILTREIKINYKIWLWNLYYYKDFL